MRRPDWLFRSRGRLCVRPVAGRALVLIYHRVATLATDPFWLAVTPGRFSQQMRFVRDHLRPMSLVELHERLDAGDVPPGATAVTFDDGYADNLLHALPVLERFEVPATVFVTSGFIERRREFWWDELDRILFQPGVWPGELELTIGGEAFSWRGDGGLSAGQRDAAREWRNWDSHDPTARHGLYRSLWKRLHPQQPEEQERVLALLRSWAGMGEEGRESHRTMTREELKRLASSPLVEIGGHTVRHVRLSAMSEETQRQELEGSRQTLEAWLGKPVTSFAYPYGAKDDYTLETAGIAREVGYQRAVSNFSGIVEGETDRYQMPRMIVQDWPGKVFGEQVSNWLG